ncbi:hypothetical protein BWI97_18295 [Siphonobacter sp. BAB-5405]|uniref:CHC2 zinc finger domain-containing protein n=1 Tax=Siphonobacter sp. BAB-5405 TaxID=1864825 RepID=UPI000C80F132|nr:toprim domain-containing protein [Siphonobacter sp. BAB-5405]PMD93543.1 hypothetical protein BWI97_18295 [Siphonobacter sp. BAB-5405]
MERLSTDLIEQAKRVLIAEYLQKRGISPAYQSGNELVYCSPLRQESTPSFFVNLSKNVFADFGGEGDKGDVIRLCQLLEKINFRTAVERLSSFEGTPFTPAFSFSGSEPDSPSPLQVLETLPLKHPVLVRYVESRGIPVGLASDYVKEVHYQRLGKRYFALGFPNDAGGFALRNGTGFKFQTRPAGITTFEGSLPGKVCVFEGFFDFLSALAYYDLDMPRYHTIVLNSTSHLRAALPVLDSWNCTQLNCFLDDDREGQRALLRFKELGFTVHDCSTLYKGHKDFNELLMAHPTTRYVPLI